MWNAVTTYRKGDEAMEFYISGSVNGASGLLSIIGRCGSEPVRPGAEFRTILLEKPRSYPEGLEQPREVEKCLDIRVKVQAVEAYGKAVSFLPANSTGVLRCAEYSVDLVPDGWILSDRCGSAND